MSGNRTHSSAKAVISALLVAACLAFQPLMLGCASFENLFKDLFAADTTPPSQSGLTPADDDLTSEPEDEYENNHVYVVEDEDNFGNPPPVFGSYRCSSSISNGTQEYGDLRAFDRDYSTSWQEYVDGSGIGEWISCSASSPQYVHSVTVIPGNCDNEISYTKNGRPTRVGISLDDEYGVLMEYHNLELEDSFRESSTLVFESPVLCSRVTVTILEAVDGTEWSDTAIAEIIVS